MLIKTRRFELELTRVSVYVRLGRRECFVGDDGFGFVAHFERRLS